MTKRRPSQVLRLATPKCHKLIAYAEVVVPFGPQGTGLMPIRRLLKGSELGADEIEILTRAFDKALRLLSVVERNDPLTEIIAREIINIGADTVRDPVGIAEIAIKRLGIKVPL
jgi:hypothetical protein